ncbi:hypothetical protein WOLCODRAFT_77491 [Wolfiporia cocos MD-104 SS10]|uniref:F-box domain-containing protein n=1 Tax=Wolfiporia cocos (strain MD-104) TaxID=742152 RepID=A0A2H3K157_WOLCO|nr:hypothetical protein WOLCODRAFT_77491 [Wolfiporia cocos MD-104 SS10]
MAALNLPEPPTRAALEDARRELAVRRQTVQELSDKIQAAEDKLARFVEESQCAIRELQKDRAALEAQVAQTLAYISPIRRLPQELLRYIFLLNFDEHPCCAWILSAVCSLWRRLVLSMPTMWSKIRLVTSQATSADTIRLWLERSGKSVPLDIEIFLVAQPVHTAVAEPLSRRRIAQGFVDWAIVGGGGWTPPHAVAHHALGGNGAAAYVQVPATPGIHILPLHGTGGTGLLGANIPALHTATLAQVDIGGLPTLVAPERSVGAHRSKKNMHWGHVAFYYLTEQMHRWERFVFRFDKQFASIAALKSVEGDAPLLREFEVSSAEAAYYGDWKWLPSAPTHSTFDTSSLRKVTLHNVPFKWSSPTLRNLQSLSIRSLPTIHVALDRILFMIAANPQLETLSLHFTSPTPPVLPLSQTTLPMLTSLSMSGHYLLTNLLEALVLPGLNNLVLDIDAREPIEESVSSLVARSGNPPLTKLSLAYGMSGSSSSLYYYGGGVGVASWHFLAELDQLLTLQVGGVPFEPLLSTLSAHDDDGQQDHWVCPNLTTLSMRGCHSHADDVVKLVQMVETRNPDVNSGFTAGGPARLQQFELYDCAAIGPDIIRWLKTRIDNVICADPIYDG